MTLLARVVRLAPALLAAVPAAAQAPHQHEPHGENLGRVAFPTSCRGEAQRRLERGVAYLHSFWYEKAGDAFMGALAADSGCAMGYWGTAMAILHPLWTPPSTAELAAGLVAADRGLALARTPRERDYLSAIRAYYADYSTTDWKTRLARYAQAMEGARARNPRDGEAAIFYGLALIAVGQAHPTDTTFVYQRRAHAILEPQFKAEPRHPGLAHYLIHTNDSPPLASLGLYAARRYALIAPDVPHALHMPSHIFTRLGLWEEAIASNIRSARSARGFERQRGMNALWDQRGHAMDYLVYAYLQKGLDGKAKQVVDQAAGVTAGFPPGSLVNAYALAAIPARYALERGAWREATRLAVRPSPEWPAAEALTRFARAVGAARLGDSAVVRAEIQELQGIETRLAAAGGPQLDWSGPVKIQRLAVAAWLARAAGDAAEAVRQATEAADLEDVTQKHPVTPGPILPARELLGDLLQELGRPTEAAAAYATSLKNAPNRARSLSGLAGAAAAAGDLTTARAKYRELLKLMAGAESGRSELQAARNFLASR